MASGARGRALDAGPFDRWPLGFGFERYYGFLQGDTNQWSPNLVQDNQYVSPPRSPEDGYHLTEDLADTAIRYVQDQKHAAPDRPFFLYFPLGAMHAPHHVAPEWVEPYRGRFDGGWERLRGETFAAAAGDGRGAGGHRAVGAAVVGPGLGRARRRRTTRATRASRRCSRASSPTPTRRSGACSRSWTTSASSTTPSSCSCPTTAPAPRAALTGTFNEHRFTLQLPDTTEENLARLDELGGFRSYNHYPWGWAWAGNTPLRLWKRYTWLGGVRTPLIVHWPAGIAARGEVRDQFVHAIDLMPTVLDSCGVDPPVAVDGVTQQPIDGASIRATFDDAAAPDPRSVQYFEMLGSRSIVLDGWKATTDHVSTGVADEERLLEGSRDFATDTWSLFRLSDDFAEARDVAADHPDVLARLQEAWLVEAGRNHVLPLVDGLVGRFSAAMPSPNPPGSRCVYRPDREPGARRLDPAALRRLLPHRGRRRARVTGGRAVRARRLDQRLRVLRRRTSDWCSR